MRRGQARARSASVVVALVLCALYACGDDAATPATVRDAGGAPVDMWAPDGDPGATEPFPIATSPGKDEDPSLLRAYDGRFWLAWYSNRDGADRIWLTSSSDGETWGTPRAITEPNEHAFYPCLVQARDQRFHLSWWEGSVGDGGKVVGRIRYASSKDTVTWSAPVSLTDFAGLAWGATIAPDALSPDTLVMAWSSDAAGDKDLYTTISTNGGASWSTPVRRVDPETNDDLPFVAAHPSGSFRMVWQRYDVSATSFEAPFEHPTNDIVHAKSSDGVAWSEFTRITADTPGALVADVFPSLYVVSSEESTANFFVTWSSVRLGATEGNVYAAGIDTGLPWTQLTPDGGYSGRVVRFGGIRRYLLVWVKDLDIWGKRL